MPVPAYTIDLTTIIELAGAIVFNIVLKLQKVVNLKLVGVK